MNGCRRPRGRHMTQKQTERYADESFSPAHCFFPFCLPSGGKGAGMTLPPAPSCGGYA